MNKFSQVQYSRTATSAELGHSPFSVKMAGGGGGLNFTVVRRMSKGRYSSVFLCRSKSTVLRESKPRFYCLKTSHLGDEFSQYQANLFSQLRFHYGKKGDLHYSSPFPMPPVLRYGFIPRSRWLVLEPGMEFSERELEADREFNKEDKFIFYTLMPCVEGATLSKLMTDAACGGKRGKRGAQLRDVFMLLKALATAISRLSLPNQGIHLIHQDIKPSNIILSLEPSCKVSLIDYDTVIFRNDPPPVALCGTFGYAAPETFFDGEVSPSARSHFAADVFSFGIIACEVLTGRRPYPSNVGASTRPSIWRAYYRMADKVPIIGKIPLQARELIAACLSFNPYDRPHPLELVTAMSRLERDYREINQLCPFVTSKEPLPTLINLK